ncbi:LOW QUALITY PROTEIN: uncharacterized protein T551_01789 [Pneumocystis jirovecii RU7]|uniref:Uncharacterized protein n=1 Tax=Pneumocystis jirovecii (strain RU7) TaxID=1408657 RepID=A0A0W4ZQ59_PNEJ7|nr:LOW QUALITY PROTEIN: uncharacterized protein T551_01789 [Pneumocystis jirovecii RU7]KTW30506.1 LOW QUALITY PROTEIN: hypothetical protein T551_01789 [Pneumocystis jirovecii RU7]
MIFYIKEHFYGIWNFIHITCLDIILCSCILLTVILSILVSIFKYKQICYFIIRFNRNIYIKDILNIEIL